MNYVKNKWVDFVPNRLLIDKPKFNEICVFSHKSNKRVYKNKQTFIGRIFIHPKTNEYCFAMEENVSIGIGTLEIVFYFLVSLKNGVVVFDGERGELHE